MKSTIDISKKLELVEKELNRISKLIDDGCAFETDRFYFSDGKICSDHYRTFRDELNSCVAQKLILEWVLCKF